MVLIKLENGCLSKIEIENSLKSFYKQLDCELIDIITISINKEYYELIIDDEGKLKSHYINLLFIDKLKIIDYIANSLLICKSNEFNELISLGEQDIINIYNWYYSCIKFFDEQSSFFIPSLSLNE